jgi:uncharacterized protein (TIGR02145 family)
MKIRRKNWIYSLKIMGVLLMLLVSKTYGQESSDSIIDIDGNVYHTITFGTQTWLKENLKVTKYRNGDIIGTTSPPSLHISREVSPKYQWPSYGDESNVMRYGRLYTYYVVTDSRGLCPTGWHIPSDAEWDKLTDYLINNNLALSHAVNDTSISVTFIGYGYEGSGSDIAKSMATILDWKVSDIIGTIGNRQASNNSSYFTALPSGIRDSRGNFGIIGVACYWWSSTEDDLGYGGTWRRQLIYSKDNLGRMSGLKDTGLSVRCVKDF